MHVFYKNISFFSAMVLLFAAAASVSTALAHSPETYTIVMDENGFSPLTITILQGDTVQFKNTDKNSRWPASNIHPTHAIYSEFDPTRPVLSGESWSFTFTKSGEWKFHDHIYPQWGGTIVVEKDSDYSAPEEDTKPRPALKERLSQFVSGIKSRLMQWYYSLFPKETEKTLAELDVFEIAKNEEELGRWLQIFGPEKIMAKLLGDSGDGALIDCHQEAHQIGRVGYEFFGATIFEKGDASCHSGFYHGAMEAFLRERGTEDLAHDIDEICSIFGTRFGLFECLHGVGHGILAYENYNMPTALQKCGDLGDSFAQQSCYGGVFMENIVTAQGLGAIPGHTTEWVNDDPLFPCNAVHQSYEVQFQCYQMQTSWMLTMYGNDFVRIGKECTKAPEAMIPVCFASLGRDTAGNTLRNPQRILETCRRAALPLGHFDECIKGALNVIVDFWGSGLRDQATELCRIVPEGNKRNCYAILTARLSDVFADKKDKSRICAGFETKHLDLCGTL